MFQYQQAQRDPRTLAKVQAEALANQAAEQNIGINREQQDNANAAAGADASFLPFKLIQQQEQARKMQADNAATASAQADEAGFRSAIPPFLADSINGRKRMLDEALARGQINPMQYAQATEPPKPQGMTPEELEQQKWERDFKERQLRQSGANTTKDNDLAAAKYELSKQKTEADMARKAVDVGEVTAQADEAVSLIDQMIGSEDGATAKHPGFGGFVGAKGISSLFGFMNKPISGTDAAGFSALYDQVKGGAFLEAVQKMKGSGALSDTEGKAAAGAITRMQAAQSEKEFIKAAKEFRTAIKNRKGRVIAKQEAGAPGMTPATPGTHVKWVRDANGKPVRQ
jgi:hypothetical protein